MFARLLLVLSLALAPLPLLAEKPAKAGGIDATALSRPGPVARAFLAVELYRQGLAVRDAFALIEAARMLGRVGVIEDAARIPTDTGKAPPKGAAEAPLPFPGAKATLDVAEAMAAGDDDLLALVDRTRAESGVPKGAIRRSAGLVGPGGVQVWTLAFAGGATAELAVLGNDASTLSIAVADETGATPCATTAAADRLYCRFTPKANGSFTVTVAHAGGGVNAYWLITN